VHLGPWSTVHALPASNRPFSATLGVLGGYNVCAPVRMLLLGGQSSARGPAFVTVSRLRGRRPKGTCALVRARTVQYSG
jgi:hypothetical protein